MEFDREMAQTRRVLERIPEDRLEWRPHVRSMTLGRLGTHLAELAGFAVRVMESERLEMMPGGVRPEVRELGTRAEILELFDRNVAAGKAAMAGSGEAEWEASWSLLANGRTVFSMPRGGVIRTTVLNHSIHHRGQLTVYLRLQNVAVPGLYGPSADEAR